MSAVPSALKRLMRETRIWISAVWLSCSDTFAEGLEAPHLRLDPAPGVVSCPALPERPAVVPGRAQGFVSGNRGRAVLFPRSPILADRDDRGGLPVDDGGVASARVIGAVGSHRADLFVVRDLVQQLRKHRAVTVAAGGKLHRANVRRGRVHGQMHLAPLAAALNTMLARLPFAITKELDPGAVHQQVQRTIDASIGDLNGQGLLTPATGSCNPARPSPGLPSSASWPPSRSFA